MFTSAPQLAKCYKTLDSTRQRRALFWIPILSPVILDLQQLHSQWSKSEHPFFKSKKTTFPYPSSSDLKWPQWPFAFILAVWLWKTCFQNHVSETMDSFYRLNSGKLLPHKALTWSRMNSGDSGDGKILNQFRWWTWVDEKSVNTFFHQIRTENFST